MTLKRLSLLDMHEILKQAIEEYSHLRCLDGIAIDEEPPFTFLEFADKRPADTKTMFVDQFIVHVHLVSKAEENDSSVPHYKNIQAIEEVFTNDLRLPKPFNLFRQSNEGLVNNFMTEETRERQAVLAFGFWVAYGFKAKI